ncbi:hypothetical protein, partial [Nocardia abscessus]|uniref:hypothetical protein n=1 Tax=Nocardia abscessus TaxID=120957 RepID=UPI002458D626
YPGGGGVGGLLPTLLWVSWAGGLLAAHAAVPDPEQDLEQLGAAALDRCGRTYLFQVLLRVRDSGVSALSPTRTRNRRLRGHEPSSCRRAWIDRCGAAAIGTGSRHTGRGRFVYSPDQ